MAITPDGVAKLAKFNYGAIAIESGAGAAANFTDEQYRARGATVVASVYDDANMILKVRTRIFLFAPSVNGYFQQI